MTHCQNNISHIFSLEDIDQLLDESAGDALAAILFFHAEKADEANVIILDVGVGGRADVPDA